MLIIFSALFGTKLTKSKNSDAFGTKSPMVNKIVDISLFLLLNEIFYKEKYFGNYLLSPAVLQSKDQPTSLLYAGVSNDNINMIWKSTTIKCM